MSQARLVCNTSGTFWHFTEQAGRCECNVGDPIKNAGLQRCPRTISQRGFWTTGLDLGTRDVT